jgi:hypothetical protein
MRILRILRPTTQETRKEVGNFFDICEGVDERHLSLLWSGSVGCMHGKTCGSKYHLAIAGAEKVLEKGLLS